MHGPLVSFTTHESKDGARSSKSNLAFDKNLELRSCESKKIAK
jgi:hypothetical protein